MNLLLLILARPALGGDGPWTLGAGEHNLYVGADYYRYGSFRGASGGVLDLSTGLTASGATLVWTLGMADGVEAEFKLPFESVRANDPRSDFCTDPDKPADFCETTSGVGDMAAHLEVRVVDELYRSPATASLALGIRSGEAYANRRGRLTTLGDGQTDVGAGIAVGRTDAMGRGWYRAGAVGQYWYRFGNATLHGRKVPGDEIHYAADVSMSVHRTFGFGPAMYGFHRLWGRDVDELDDFDDLDAFSSLRASQVKVGGKVGIYSPNDGPIISLGVLRTVYAENNPSDTLSLSLGIGWWIHPEVPDPLAEAE